MQEETLFFDPELFDRARKLIESYTTAGLTLATAESCTGGLVAALLTEVPGSSAVVEAGFVTYSNGAKSALIGVPAALIEAHGAVSEPVARAMAEGALSHSTAAIAVAITGIAGPSGGSPEKPVGLVHFALAERGRSTRTVQRRFGNPGRSQVRHAALVTALELFESRPGS
jgi:nicotinamide-nucleotide amidase